MINVNIVTMDYINIVTMDIMCFITMDNKNIVTMDNKNIVNMDNKISVTMENTNIVTLNINIIMDKMVMRIRLIRDEKGVMQDCIFRLTRSYPELTEDHVLTSAYVKMFRTVTRYAVNNSA